MADKPIDRRRFFKHSLSELIKPLAHAIAPLERVAGELGKLEAKPPSPSPVKPQLGMPAWLRPPGALREQEFASTCSRCGECVKVCPAECIAIDETGRLGGGLPYINVNAMPCTVCEGLKCMYACPSGALQPTALAEIDMGMAAWKPDLCLRNKGDNCTICVDRCPLGSAAIELKDNKVHVIEDGCIGCGVCQHECPTTPKSILVTPRVARTN